jgi:catechol 2,3-dioxygenase-like lactoylglutathione lyase family enzyme
MATQAKTAPNVEQAIPFFRVTSMETSLRFYVDGLGFEMTKKWTPDSDGKVRWCWLQHGNAAIMLQEFRQDGPQPMDAGKQSWRGRFHLLPVQRRSGHL